MTDLPLWTRLAPARSEARRLLRAVRRPAPDATAAAARFAALRELPAAPADLARAARLRHALTVVALESGFAGWAAFVQAAERSVPMHTPAQSALLNRWHARYGDAHTDRDAHGGFLFPYRSQFFVCEAEGVVVLGLDPADPDWERIGFDWVQPRDPRAWRRLCAKRMAAL